MERRVYSNIPNFQKRNGHQRKGKLAECPEEGDIIKKYKKVRLEVEKAVAFDIPKSEDKTGKETTKPKVTGLGRHVLGDKDENAKEETATIQKRKVELIGADKFSVNMLDRELCTHDDIKREDFMQIIKRYTQFKSGNPTDRYQKGEKLGSGGQADVYLGTELATGKNVALKIQPIPKVLDPVKYKGMCSEVICMLKVDHKNIIKFHECYVCNDALWIIMDLVEGVSVSELVSQMCLDESEMAAIIKDTLDALHHIHTRGLIHCDIKASNIMLGKNGVAKVIDFGLCTERAVGLKQLRGTQHFTAPEVAHRLPHDEKVDIWALGITIHEMWFSHVPYEGKPAKEIYRLIRENGRPDYDRNALSSRLQNFLDRCLEPDPAKRPSAADLLLHPFLKDTKSQRAMARICHKAWAQI